MHFFVPRLVASSADQDHDASIITEVATEEDLFLSFPLS